MAKFFVTGGAGFIGSALVKRLIDDNHEVVVLDNVSRGKFKRFGPLHYGRGNLRLVKGDVRNYDDVLNAMHGCDSVIHAAYVQGTQTFYSEPREVLEVAAEGMLNVLHAMQANGITELFLLSSSEAYQIADKTPTDESVPLVVPDPLNPRYSYGGGKILCEIMANAWTRSGILTHTVIVRPHNIYGPDMGNEHVIPEFARRMKKLVEANPDTVIEFPIQGSGLETRSFCHIIDFVNAFMLLLDTKEDIGIYHVGTQDEKSIADVAYAVGNYYNRLMRIVPGALPKGSPPRRCPDTSKIEALGYRPIVSFKSGLKDTLSWYDAN